jgi:hypothetical protein
LKLDVLFQFETCKSQALLQLLLYCNGTGLKTELTFYIFEAKV